MYPSNTDRLTLCQWRRLYGGAERYRGLLGLKDEVAEDYAHGEILMLNCKSTNPHMTSKPTEQQNNAHNHSSTADGAKLFDAY